MSAEFPYLFSTLGEEPVTEYLEQQVVQSLSNFTTSPNLFCAEEEYYWIFLSVIFHSISCLRMEVATFQTDEKVSYPVQTHT